MSDIDLLNLNPNRGFKILGAAAGDAAGAPVSNAGDINGDGINDIIIGARNADPNSKVDAGIAYVIYGSSTALVDIDLLNLKTEQGFRILGAAKDDATGYSVSGAGDINNDGVDDIIVGTYYDGSNSRAVGAAYVIYGKQGVLPGKPYVFDDINLANPATQQQQWFKIIDYSPNAGAGWVVSDAGDVNGDGVNDVIIGTSYVSPGGAAYVIYGKSGGLSNIDLSSMGTTQGFKIIGAATGDLTGSGVSKAGDVNGDGFDDVIIGAYYASPNARSHEGAAYVIYGTNRTGLIDVYLASLTAERGFKIIGAAFSNQIGNTVSDAGDINGDGLSDVIVGANAANKAYVIYGKSNGPASVDLLSLTPAQGFRIAGDGNAGYAVSTAGDINDDGLNDLIVGAIYDGRTGAGAAYVIYCNSSNMTDIDLRGLTSMQGFKIQGEDAGGLAGIGVSDAGDVNDDGLNDLIVGAIYANPKGRTHAGAAYVIYGKKHILGTAGDDVIFPGIKPEDIDGLSGADTVNYATSDAGIVVNLATNTGSGGYASGDVIYNCENIIGSGLADILTGDAGNNTIQGGAGADILDGGAGIDTVSYMNSTNAVTINWMTNTIGGGDATGDIISHFENIIGSGFADILTGDGNANNIQGNAGNDIIEGRAGGDVLDGGAGIDTISYTNSASSVTINLVSGIGAGGDAAGDVVSNFENIVGSSYADILIGDGNANNIQGGTGVDTLDGGAGIDTISYTNSAAGVTISLASGTGTTGDATGDTISNFENIIGSGLADILTGDNNTNNIQGGVGDDIIEGKAGADTLDGGAGTDTISYASSTNGITISLVTNSVSGGDATGDIISNFENIIGSGFADTLTGDIGNNNIQGGAGDDVIRDGSGGNDVFTGGQGADQFVVSQLSGVVTITDFDGTEDKIDLDKFDIDFVQVIKSAQNNGNNCEITLGSKTINLHGINKSNMQASWFASLIINPDAPTTQPSGVSGMSKQDIIKIVSSVISTSVTIVGFVLKSYHYYKPGILGHDKFYSFASSLVPKFIMKTTAAIVSRADASINSVLKLKTAYTTIGDERTLDRLQQALTSAILDCKAVALRAEVIKKTAESALLTATGKAEQAAQATVDMANRAFNSYAQTIDKFTAIQMEVSGKSMHVTELIPLAIQAPIGIALSSNKIELISLGKSQTFFDYSDNGIKAKTAWVGPHDAFLVYDHNDNGLVDAAKELVLTQWSKAAITDFIALKEVFDSNKDNKFDAMDTEFNRFRIWQDKNQDGISQGDELTTLLKAGLLQIDFNTERAVHDEFFDVEQDMNIAEVLWANGNKTLAYDLGLEINYEV